MVSDHIRPLCCYCSNAKTGGGGGNNCNAADNNPNECKVQNDFHFTTRAGDTGNACSGVEIKVPATSSSACGCKPSAETSCTFVGETVSDDEKCFICSARDHYLLDIGDDSQKSLARCGKCRDCVRQECPAIHQCYLNCDAGSLTELAAIRKFFRSSLKSSINRPMM